MTKKKRKIKTPPGEEKKEKKEKQSLRRVISNNFYMLKIMHRTAPANMYFPLVSNVIGAVINFLTWTLGLRMVFNDFQTGKPISQPMLYFFVLLGFNYLWYDVIGNLFYNKVYPFGSLKLEGHMNGRIYDKIATLELAAYENTSFYDRYVQVAGDAVNRVNGVVNTTTSALWNITSFSLNTFFILTIDPWLTVFAVIPLFSSYFIGRIDNKYMFEYNMKFAALERQRDYTRRTFYLSDYAKEMRLTHIPEVMLARFERTTAIIRAYMKKTLPLHAFLQFMIGEIQYCLCTYGAMIFVIYRTLVTHDLLFGDLLVIINTIGNLTWLMNRSASMLADFHSHSLYVEKLRSFFDYQPTVRDGEKDAPADCADLVLRDVSFRYDGQEEDTLHGVNITLHAGEKIALVGHNGAGKTTIAKLMMRLYDPTGGTVEYGGQNVRDYKLTGDGGYRERFATVFQDFKLFSMSVADNILLRERREGDDELIAEAMKRSGVDGKVDTLPEKENTMLTREFDDNGTVLSGGEGQKVAIARAFAKDAQVVILDEPSSALDPIAEYKMYENMMHACEHKSVVFISHRLSSATLADTVYLLENGQVIEHGSHDDLMRVNGKYAEMFRIQAQNYVDEKEAEE